jgi:hypothetical protein
MSGFNLLENFIPDPEALLKKKETCLYFLCHTTDN